MCDFSWRTLTGKCIEVSVNTTRDCDPYRVKTAARIIANRYQNKESMLFTNNPEQSITRTNNGMERLFRRVRKNARKRCGNTATGNILAQSGSLLILFQNVDNREYVGILFGSEDIASVFGRHRKPFLKNGMMGKEMIRTIEKETKIPMKDSLPGTPSKEGIMENAHSARKRAEGSNSL